MARERVNGRPFWAEEEAGQQQQQPGKESGRYYN